MFIRIEVLDVVHRLKQHDKYLVVRFLALVITMVTMVDHHNNCSNNRGNHRGYYDSYYNGNTFFLQ